MLKPEDKNRHCPLNESSMMEELMRVETGNTSPHMGVVETSVPGRIGIAESRESIHLWHKKKHGKALFKHILTAGTTST